MLERIAGRDAHALADLYDSFAPVGLALAARILGDRSEAEKVLQVVFTRVWQEAGRLDPAKGSAATWLLARIRDGAIDRLRRRAARHSADPSPVVSKDGVSHLDSSAERERVTRAVAELSPDQRQVIELAYFEGLSQTQIAQRLQESLGSVKTRMRLGMNTLRQVLPVLSGEAHWTRRRTRFVGTKGCEGAGREMKTSRRWGTGRFGA